MSPGGEITPLGSDLTYPITLAALVTKLQPGPCLAGDLPRHAEWFVAFCVVEEEEQEDLLTVNK